MNSSAMSGDYRDLSFSARLPEVMAGVRPGNRISAAFIIREGAPHREVTILFENIPPGIRPEDNDAGARSSLKKLARYVE